MHKDCTVLFRSAGFDNVEISARAVALREERWAVLRLIMIFSGNPNCFKSANSEITVVSIVITKFMSEIRCKWIR